MHLLRITLVLFALTSIIHASIRKGGRGNPKTNMKGKKASINDLTNQMKMSSGTTYFMVNGEKHLFSSFDQGVLRSSETVSRMQKKLKRKQVELKEKEQVAKIQESSSKSSTKD